MVARQRLDAPVVRRLGFLGKEAARHALVMVTMMGDTFTAFPVSRAVVCAGTRACVVTVLSHVSFLPFFPVMRVTTCKSPGAIAFWDLHRSPRHLLTRVLRLIVMRIFPFGTVCKKFRCFCAGSAAFQHALQPPPPAGAKKTPCRQHCRHDGFGRRRSAGGNEKKVIQ